MPWLLTVRKSGYFEIIEIPIGSCSEMKEFSLFIKDAGLSLAQIAEMTKIDLSRINVLNDDGLIGVRAQKKIKEFASSLKRKSQEKDIKTKPLNHSNQG